MKNLSSAILAAILFLPLMSFARGSDIITIVVTNTAGGPVDVHAREFSKVLSSNGIDNVVINLAGGGGDIAYNHTMTKKNSILFLSSATLVFANVPGNRPPIIANTMELFGPYTYNPLALMVPLTSQFDTLTKLIAAAKTDTIPCGVSNLHGQIQLELLNRRYNLRFNPVLYQGTTKLQPDLIGSHIPCAFDQTAAYTNLDKQIRQLGTSDRHHINQMPPISSVLPDYHFVNYFLAAVPNDSDLLKDQKIVRLLHTWIQQKEHADSLVIKGYTIAQIDPGLKRKAIDETAFYQNLLKR